MVKITESLHEGSLLIRNRYKAGWNDLKKDIVEVAEIKGKYVYVIAKGEKKPVRYKIDNEVCHPIKRRTCSSWLEDYSEKAAERIKMEHKRHAMLNRIKQVKWEDEEDGILESVLKIVLNIKDNDAKN